MARVEERIWLDVEVRWWVPRWLLSLLLRRLGRVPRWTVRIRKVPPPAPEGGE